jgi:hypothetical protein
VSKNETEVRLWAEHLLGGPVDVSPLSGGANNHLFVCRSVTGQIVVKRYRAQNFGADFSRQQAEVTFLTHAAVTASGFVPRLLAVHDREDMIAMSFLRGEIYREGAKILESDVSSVINFYRQINLNRELVSCYPIAAREGYLSISEHLSHVDQRLNAFSVGHLPVAVRQAAELTIGDVNRVYSSVQDSLLRLIQAGDLTDILPNGYLQLSPGDFGFHNAMRATGGAVFFDFEYAGLDDPAKTLVDFFLQPKLPVTRNYFDQVAEGMAVSIPFDFLRARAAAMHRLLFTKWLAIILAPLDSARFGHFVTRYGENLLSEISSRLNRANALLATG